ncbi:hypothetical protein RUM43_013638, partial [Polyplax serrata]
MGKRFEVVVEKRKVRPRIWTLRCCGSTRHISAGVSAREERNFCNFEFVFFVIRSCFLNAQNVGPTPKIPATERAGQNFWEVRKPPTPNQYSSSMYTQ